LDGKVKDVINGRSIDIQEEREDRSHQTSAFKQSGSKLKVKELIENLCETMNG